MLSAASKPIRSIAASAGLLLISTTFAVVLLEAVLRSFFSTMVDSDYHCVWPPHLRVVFRPDPEIMPGVFGPANFITNARGLRGDEFSREERYEILAIGGSTTECLYLDHSEAWPYLVQDALNQALQGPEVWVGNAGKSGLTTRDHIVQLRYLLPELPGLDAIILLIGVNDLALRNLQDVKYDSRYMDRPGVEGKLLPRAFGVYPLRSRVLPRHERTAIWQLGRNVKRQLRAVGREYQGRAGTQLLRWRTDRQRASKIRQTIPDLAGALQEYSRNVDTLIDLCEGRGVRPIFLTQPTLWRPGLSTRLRNLLWVGKIGEDRQAEHEYYSVRVLAAEMESYNKALQERCRARRVECIDLASRLPRDTTVFYDDDHFNEQGAQAVSELIAWYLLQRPPFGDTALDRGTPGLTTKEGDPSGRTSGK